MPNAKKYCVWATRYYMAVVWKRQTRTKAPRVSSRPKYQIFKLSAILLYPQNILTGTSVCLCYSCDAIRSLVQKKIPRQLTRATFKPGGSFSLFIKCAVKLYPSATCFCSTGFSETDHRLTVGDRLTERSEKVQCQCYYVRPLDGF